MAITLTGGKYTSAAVSSVGTTTVTVGTTPFISGDFSVARRVDLYNSAGTTFKGMAFVRRWVSASQLEMETEFFDPKTGANVTQVVGDTVLVSKNWVDVVQTGIAISNNVITISDVITLGTAGAVNSLAFHDEDCFVVSTVSAASSHGFTVAGGLTTFGHLQSWPDKSWYAGVSFYYSMTIAHVAIKASSTSGRILMFGGSIKGNGSNPLYVGSGYSGNTDYGQLWLLNVKLANCDVNSPTNWSVPTNHVLENCSFTGTGASQILVRFRDGLVLGGQYKIPRYSSNPISIFGDDTAGTYAIGAPSEKRAVVLDMGSGNVLWRAQTNAVQTINCTNLISTDYRMGDGSAQTNGTKNIYFKDQYSNLADLSALGIIRDSDWSIDSSATASGTPAAVDLTVYHSTGTGHTLGTQRGPWTNRIRKYGYDEIESVIAESAYSLGTAGTAFDVAFGGVVNQVERQSLTDSVATALAYNGITVTDHGTSPVAWNSKLWSITVTVDLATYPSRTAAQVFAHIKAGIAQTASWNGKAGLLWHILMEESSSGYTSQRGKSGGAGAVLKGVRIVDQAGNPLPNVGAMVADDGTTYVPPVAVTLTVSAQVSLVGAEIRIYDLDNTPAGSLGTELGGVESCADATFPYTGSAGNAIWIQIMKAGYVEFGQATVMPASSAGFTATLKPETDA